MGVPYRTETSSLVCVNEIREVLLALAAVADPTDELATIAALRSFVYGCGDDGIAHWRLGVRGRFSFEHRSRRSPIRSPSVCSISSSFTRLVSGRPRPNFSIDSSASGACSRPSPAAASRCVAAAAVVIDQARAWVDAGGVDLRAYLRWARLQGADNAQVSETVLPETDDDSVQIHDIMARRVLSSRSPCWPV